MKKKKCSKCEKIQPVSEFYRDKRNKDGYNYSCKTCENVYATAWRKANPEKVKAKSRGHTKRSFESRRNTKLKMNFGIALIDYDKMWHDQNGLCAVCGEPETATLRGIVKHLSVDHNHETGRVRALLCNNCNCSLGFAEDSVERLISLAEYLKRHN